MRQQAQTELAVVREQQQQRAADEPQALARREKTVPRLLLEQQEQQQEQEKQQEDEQEKQQEDAVVPLDLLAASQLTWLRKRCEANCEGFPVASARRGRHEANHDPEQEKASVREGSLAQGQ